MKEKHYVELLEAARAVKSAHSHIATVNMPEWLEMIEAAIDKVEKEED